MHSCCADDDNDAVLFEKIKSGNYDADDPIWDNVSPEAKDIVAKLLTVDADHRLSAEQALRHPWVEGKCFENDEQKGGYQIIACFHVCRHIASVARDIVALLVAMVVVLQWWSCCNVCSVRLQHVVHMSHKASGFCLQGANSCKAPWTK